MLGSYRLGLALLVALSHVGVTVRDLNPGVVAVVGFYIVSGYVMTALIRTHYNDIRKVAWFYSDRLLRIYPHYLAVAFVTLAWYVVQGVHTEYLRGQPDVVGVTQNLLVIPLNFFMFNRSDRFTLIPPAWSLGAEIQFYLLIPFLLLAAAYVRRFAIGVSLAVFLFAAIGTINSDWFGYRLLPGILFVFLFGSVLHDLHRHAKRTRRLLFVGAVLVAIFVAVATLHVAGKLVLPYNREVLLGLALGAIAVDALGPLKRNRTDDSIGNLSYGVFLNHFFVLWVVFNGKVEGTAQIVGYLATSIAMSLVLYNAIERPVLAIRRALRARPNGSVVPLGHPRVESNPEPRRN